MSDVVHGGPCTVGRGANQDQAGAGAGAGGPHVTHVDMLKLLHLGIPQWTEVHNYDFTE